MRPPYPSGDDFPFDGPQPEPWHRPAPREALRRLGMGLFLASLSSLFIASLVGYLMTRYQGGNRPPAGFLNLPSGLWASTGVLLGAGCMIHLAHRAARAGRLEALRWRLGATLVLSLLFLGVQVPSLMVLMERHREMVVAQIGLYGLGFALIVLHALHVVGGLVPLAWTTIDAFRRVPAYLQSAQGVLTVRVRFLAVYWHFLEIVWLVMFGVFLLSR